MLSFINISGRASPRIKNVIYLRLGGKSQISLQGYHNQQMLLSPSPSGLGYGCNGGAFCYYSTSVRMPSLSPTMSEGTIVKWYKAEGEAVQPGDVLCDIQTDKAVVSFEFDNEGILARVLRADGASGLVGDVIAVMADPGEDWRAVAAEAAKSTPATPAAKSKTPLPASASAAAPSPLAPQPPTSSKASSSSVPPRRVGPAALLLLRLHHLTACDLRATGPHGTLLKSDVAAHVKAAPAASAVSAPPPAHSPAVATPVSPAAASASRPSMSPLEPRTPPGYLDHPVAPGLRDWAALQAAIKSTAPHAYATAACRPRLSTSTATSYGDGSSPIVALAVRALAIALSAGGDAVNVGVLQLAAPALPRLVRLPRAQALGLAEIARRLAAGSDTASNSSGPLAAIVCDLSGQAAVQSAHFVLHPDAPLLVTVGRPSADLIDRAPQVRLGLTVDSRRFDHAEAAALLGSLVAGMESPLLGLSGLVSAKSTQTGAAAAAASTASVAIVGSDLLQLGLDD